MNSNLHTAPAPTRRELTQFGCGLGLLLGATGGVLLWRGHTLGGALLISGLIVAAACWRQWPGTRALYAGWMRFAGIMARVVTTVLLTALFLLVLTPTALLAKVVGKRFLELGFREQCGSYWRTRENAAADSDCGKQF